MAAFCIMTLSVATLSIELEYFECRIFIVMLNVVILNVVAPINIGEGLFIILSRLLYWAVFTLASVIHKNWSYSDSGGYIYLGSLAIATLRVIYTKQPKLVWFLLSDQFCQAVCPFFKASDWKTSHCTKSNWEIGKFLSQNCSENLAKLARQPGKIGRTWQKSEATLFV